MSFTVADVLKLPSMAGAEVAAGHNGLSNPVESVTVLEYGRISDVLDELFQHNRFEGNEMMISAFANILDNVDTQCANIRRYHSVGSVALVLYYVGVILPEIDQRLIDCCNELDFVLICMPKGRVDLRYSDVISEVMFEIYRANSRSHFFVSTLIDRISKLQPQQRTMETLLRMLSEHLRASAVLTDHRAAVQSAVYWPRSIEDALSGPFQECLKKVSDRQEARIPLGDTAVHLQRCPALLDDADSSRLYLLKYGDPLSSDALWQASEVVRLFIHIWNQNHGRLMTSELIRAIINDEPLNMNRLAKLFHIQVSDLDQIWIFARKSGDAGPDEKLLRLCTEFFPVPAGVPLLGYYEGKLIACTMAPRSAAQRHLLADSLAAQLRAEALEYEIVCCECLNNTAEVRQAYLDSVAYWETARRIFPRREVLYMADISIAKQCQLLAGRRETLEYYQALLVKIQAAGAELLGTASVYLLDAASNMALTAKLLFVHLNTVKYRLKLIHDSTGLSPYKSPDAYQIYIALALNRILHDTD